MIKRKIKIYINTNDLAAKLNSLADENGRYSHKGLFNDYDLLNSSQWIIQKGGNEKEFILFKTSNTTTPNYLVSHFVKLTIIDSGKIEILLMFKKYILWISVWIFLIFITLVTVSILDGNPMFILYIILLISGVIILSKDMKKFEKKFLEKIKNLINE